MSRVLQRRPSSPSISTLSSTATFAVGAYRYDCAMDLPDNFTLTMPGGVMIATCQCGATSPRILPVLDGPDELEQWCREHRCGSNAFDLGSGRE